MKLTVWFDHEKQAPILESFVHDKANDAFARHAHRLSSGTIRLRLHEGSNGLVTHCSLDLKSHSNGIIHVNESDENGQTAVLKAIRVAQSKLKRMTQRRKHASRTSGRIAKQVARESELELELEPEVDPAWN